MTAQYVIPSAVLSPNDPPIANFVARTQSFTVNDNIPVVSTGGLFAGTLRVTGGLMSVYVDTIIVPANTVGYVWVTSDNRPIYMTTVAHSANLAEQQLSPLFPGFNVTVRDSATNTGLRSELDPKTGLLRDRHFIVRSPGDTLQKSAMQFTLFVQPMGSFTKRNRGGAYTIAWDTDPWGPAAPFALDPVANLDMRVSASFHAAAAKMTNETIIDQQVAQQVGATAARPLVRVKVPFRMTFADAESGESHPVQLAMLRRTIFPYETRILGTGTDTARVFIPDTLWMPGDTLFAIHPVMRDSTIVVGGTRVTVVKEVTIGGVGGFEPIRVPVDSVGLHKFVVSCQPGAVSVGNRSTGSAFENTTCNPVAIGTRGATPNGGYLQVATGWTEYFELTNTFKAPSEVALTALPFTTGATPNKAAVSRVNVVPNPYVVASEMDDFSSGMTRSRIWFTGLPPQGMLRIYSVSGEWIQEINWTPADLAYKDNMTVSGDLPFNLKTRSGFDMTSGLYLYVVTPTGAQTPGEVYRGKFVIIR